MDEERMSGRKALGKVRKPKVPKKAVKNKQTKTNRQSKDKEKVARKVGRSSQASWPLSRNGPNGREFWERKESISLINPPSI